MSAKLHQHQHQHQQHQHQHQQHQHQQHLKSDSNVASFGGTVTTTVSAAEGSSLRSVEKNAVLTEQQLDDMYQRNHHTLQGAASDASLTSSGASGDTASDGSLAASVSSGVSTESVELMMERRQHQQPQEKQQQRFASLLTVENGPAAWASHAHVTFRYRSERLYYLDSASRLHGPMDQREQCRVATVRRHASRSGQQQAAVATRSHRTVQQSTTGASAKAALDSLDDGLLLLERRFTSSQATQQKHQHQHQHQHHQQQHQQRSGLGGSGGGGGGASYSRVQVNQYDDWSGGGAPLPRSYSQQLDYGGGGDGVGGGGFGERELRFLRRQHSREHVQHPQQQQQQHQHQHYQHSYQQHRSGPVQQHQPQPQHPAFDARLEHLERSLNQAMESIRRQQQTTSSHSHRQHRHPQQHQHHQHHHQQQHHRHHYTIDQQQNADDFGGSLRRFNSEPPFEFRYSQRTMTREPPHVTEEVETTTLQPIGRGIHDLGGGARVTTTQTLQQRSSVTEQRASRSGRLAVRHQHQPDAPGAAATGRSLSANRNATLRASTPVSPKLPTAAASASRGRHLSANAQREFAAQGVY